MTTLHQRKINHVAFVIDESGSMQSLAREVVTVFDGQVRWLLDLSKKMDQETRVSLYTLGGQGVKCVLFDTDVHHLPSLKGHYVPQGGTPLIDATLKSIEDLGKTAQMYGDHGFLIFVLTDGEENSSLTKPPGYRVPAYGLGPYGSELGKIQIKHLVDTIKALPENWTLGCLVPNINGKITAQGYGFDAGNIAIWDVNSATGVSDAGEEIKQATESYYTSRASGIRGSKTLFSGITAANVTQAQVDASGMKAIDPSEFIIVPVVATGNMQYVIPKKSITKSRPDGLKHVEIMPFVEATGRRYVAGKAFYELVKSEKYEYHKDVALIHRQTKKVYKGEQAKALIGLTGTSTRIRPQAVKGGEYDIFVQSQSINRHLPLGSRVLLFNK